MPAKRSIVTLTADERATLDALTRAGKRSARTITRARVPLLTDQGDGGPGWEDRRVAEALGCGHRTVERVRERFVTDGLDAALSHAKPAEPPRRPVLDGAAEPRLIALACSPPRRPQGVDPADAGRQAGRAGGGRDCLPRDGPPGAPKNALKPHLKPQWCRPGGPPGGVAARMEDVLEVYHRPYDERRPLICIDEQPKQLVSETRVPVPPQPGAPARHDYEYKREGVANLFMLSQPLIGWRYVWPTERRTARDFAEVLRWLAEELYPDAEELVLVTDTLNTHSTACLYEAFEPARARRIAGRLEWHYTPEHGSWLNMAEVEFAALSEPCLDRRIGSMARPKREVAAWEEDRNERRAGVNWRFATVDARVRLRSLYPSIED